MLLNGEELLVPAPSNFGSLLLNRLRKVNPERTCLQSCAAGDTLSFGEFVQYAGSLSAALAQLGVGRGDTVLVAGEPRITTVPTGIAVILAGATYFPMELECGRTVLAHKLNLTKPNCVICSRLFWEEYNDILKGLGFIKNFISFEAIEDIELSVETMVSKSKHEDVAAFEPAAAGAGDVAMVKFTSGTTGTPKGVQLTHLSCIIQGNLHIQSYNDFDALKTSQIHQPIFFPDAKRHISIYEFFMIIAFISTGNTAMYSEKEVNLKIIQDFQVNAIATVPATVEKLVNLEGVDLSSVKFIYNAGSSLHPQTVKKFREKYPNIKLINLYGASEIGLTASTNTPNFEDTNEVPDIKISSIGNAESGVTIKIVDVDSRAILGPNQRGEICVQNPRVMKGYLGSTSPYLDEQGFYLTGDLGYYDDHKRLYMVDRLKDVISYLGNKVCPTELESVLLQHSAVREVAVAGVPAGADGEHATAFVVLQPGAVVTEAELQDYVAREVTWYMCLFGGVRFLSKLPRNLNGKIMRRQLVEMSVEERKELEVIQGNV